MILRRRVGNACLLLSVLAFSTSTLLTCARQYPGIAPTITSVDKAICIVGTNGYFLVTATGTPHPTITETGALPDGVTFSASDSTGLLQGTPTEIGTFSFTFTARNDISPNAVQNFVLTVNPPE
jgi:hypothetical protein